MCGILGFASLKNSGDASALRSLVSRLLITSESRGKEAAGLAVSLPDRIDVHREALAASAMIKTAGFNAFLHRAWNDLENQLHGLSFIGHARLVTNGLQTIDANNQPVVSGSCVLVHNGIVVNDSDLWANTLSDRPVADVDTEVIGALLEHHYKDRQAMIDATRKTFRAIVGEASVLSLFTDRNVMLLATNTGSLFVAENEAKDAIFIVSEARMARELIGTGGLPGFERGCYRKIPANGAVLIDLQTLKQTAFSLGEDVAIPYTASTLGVHRRVDGQWIRNEEARRSLRRCTRCVLPETMPYIAFDASGVCNYCLSHAPAPLLGKAALDERLSAVRKTTGEADCVVAFSGGRDSSYGLHLLRREYGMTPLAYTYDWGMVTDLARRNQARMCGQLGIEHIWISADIKAKRNNIRRNVEAWMRRPDLGMIPLFMAGDKQFLWYANSVMKTERIDTMVFCANQHEKTDFKTGFLGVNSQHASIGKPSSMTGGGKFGLLANYGMRFLSNPRYLNRSLPDTAWAYVSYYLIKQNYLQVFDYLPWEENEIASLLAAEYDWEFASDTNSSWRIGDGTAPFYNYVYFSVAGFSEFDTFRSSQVRTGELTRDQAVALVTIENEPRWESMREYFQTIDVDFDRAVRAIDRIPKLYAR